jgi:hypothetical protein
MKNIVLCLALVALFCAPVVFAGSREETTDAAADVDVSSNEVTKRNYNGPNNNNLRLCQTLFDTRNQLLQQFISGATSKLDQWSYGALKASVQLIDQSLVVSQCCASNSQALAYFTTKYAPASGIVCGMDFNTYSTPAAACPVGVYHANACFSHNTNLACYYITDLSQRIQCIGGVSGLITEVLSTSMLANAPDGFLLSTVPPCTGPGYDNTYYRQADGSCNNKGTTPIPGVTNPLINMRISGMAGSKFSHEWSGAATLNASITNTDYVTNGPNPREVSLRLFTQTNFIPNPVNANGLAMAWVNFFVHDFMNHQNDDWQNFYAIPLPDNDPLWDNYYDDYPNDLYMLIPNTRPSNDWNGQGLPPRRNLATAWFDQSQVYGTDLPTQYYLRAFQGGFLRMNPATNNLPDDPNGDYRIKGAFLAGDFRVNFHPGLTAMHTIWAREHNNLATLLAKAYPSMTDEQLFQTARLINNREMVKVHESEWSNQMYTDPADQTVTLGLLGLLTPSTTPQPLGNLNVPEEFVANYKWHTFVNPYITLRNNNGQVINGASNIDYIAQFQDTTLIRTHGISAVAVGLATAPCGIQRFGNLPPGLQNNFHPFLTPRNVNFFQYSQCEVVPVFDSMTTDIICDRERGVPKYNALRQLVGQGNLPLANFFDDLSDNSQEASTLADLYQWNLNNVDAIVGSHGEHLYPNQGFPLTMVSAFVPFVVNRVIQDRFQTTDFTTTKYTQWGLNRIAYVDFSQILCDNGVTCNVPDRTKVFQVWDTTKMGTQTITPTAS